MLKLIVALMICAIFASASCAEDLEIRLISPMGAAIRSIVPGWGQFYTGNKIQGIIVFLTVGMLGGSAIKTDSVYKYYYNEKYKPAVLSDSEDANFYFNKANDYYKLTRFLLYTAGGIWVYSAMDAYVDAHIYNAQQKASVLYIEDQRIQPLKLETEYR